MLADTSRLLFNSEEARRRNQQVFEARKDLLAILRRAEARHQADTNIAALIRHYEGREKP